MPGTEASADQSESEDEDKQLVSSLMTSQHTIDQKMEEAQLQVFSNQPAITSQDAARSAHACPVDTWWCGNTRCWVRLCVHSTPEILNSGD